MPMSMAESNNHVQMSLPIDTRLSDDADIGSGSETEDEDGSRKRKRPMNVTYVLPHTILLELCYLEHSTMDIKD